MGENDVGHIEQDARTNWCSHYTSGKRSGASQPVPKHKRSNDDVSDFFRRWSSFSWISSTVGGALYRSASLLPFDFLPHVPFVYDGCCFLLQHTNSSHQLYDTSKILTTMTSSFYVLSSPALLFTKAVEASFKLHGWWRQPSLFILKSIKIRWKMLLTFFCQCWF